MDRQVRPFASLRNHNSATVSAVSPSEQSTQTLLEIFGTTLLVIPSLLLSLTGKIRRMPLSLLSTHRVHQRRTCLLLRPYPPKSPRTNWNMPYPQYPASKLLLLGPRPARKIKAKPAWPQQPSGLEAGLLPRPHDPTGKLRSHMYTPYPAAGFQTAPQAWGCESRSSHGVAAAAVRLVSRVDVDRLGNGVVIERVISLW